MKRTLVLQCLRTACWSGMRPWRLWAVLGCTLGAWRTGAWDCRHSLPTSTEEMDGGGGRGSAFSSAKLAAAKEDRHKAYRAFFPRCYRVWIIPAPSHPAPHLHRLARRHDGTVTNVAFVCVCSSPARSWLMLAHTRATTEGAGYPCRFTSSCTHSRTHTHTLCLAGYPCRFIQSSAAARSSMISCGASSPTYNIISPHPSPPPTPFAPPPPPPPPPAATPSLDPRPIPRAPASHRRTAPTGQIFEISPPHPPSPPPKATRESADRNAWARSSPPSLPPTPLLPATSSPATSSPDTSAARDTPSCLDLSRGAGWHAPSLGKSRSQKWMKGGAPRKLAVQAAWLG